jgi:hypothetical protein
VCLWQVLNDVHDLGQDFLWESSEQVITLLLLSLHMLEPEFALSIDEPGFRSRFPEGGQLHVSSVLLRLLFVRHCCSGGSPIVEVFKDIFRTILLQTEQKLN